MISRSRASLHFSVIGVLALFGCASTPPPKTTAVTSYTPVATPHSSQTYSTAWLAPDQKMPADRTTVNSSNQQLYGQERTPISTSNPAPVNAPLHPSNPNPGIP